MTATDRRAASAPALTARPADEYPASAGYPAEGPASGAAGLAADAVPGAQADPSAGPGSLFYAIRKWHECHPDFGSPSPEVAAVLYPIWARPARLIGVSLAEYADHRLNGERWCIDHGWHPEGDFYDSSPRVTRCREAQRAYVAMRRRSA